jgi:hypothetical protein
MAKQPRPPSVRHAFRKANGREDAAPPCRQNTAPVSLRMSFEEKDRLERAAAGMSVAAYIRWRLFDPDSPPPRTRGKQPVKDHKAIARLLALLGQSRLANNVNQLARAANSGSLPLTPDTERALTEAANDISEIRKLLLQALSLEPGP